MPHNKRTLLTIGALSGLLALGAVASAAAPVAMEAPGFTTDRSAKLASEIDPSKPRNVILLIGDGTDDSMITAARNYQLGAAVQRPVSDGRARTPAPRAAAAAGW